MGAGDNGDPDLQQALSAAHEQGVHVPLVLFGHMHHMLSRRRGNPESYRNMVHIDPSTGTVCLNAAVVPRWREREDAHLSHFTIADIKDGIVTFAAHVWVKTEEKDGNGMFQRCPAVVVEVEELLQQLPAEDSSKCVRRIRLAHSNDSLLVASRSESSST